MFYYKTIKNQRLSNTNLPSQPKKPPLSSRDIVLSLELQLY